ncbi:MAG: glycerol-3-phosphate 1-O-acyltransferase PlsY [Rubrivivax sp.]|nr:glycerol-3-phosphate 1-O-acyltransferase PlsY [Rubrivivax sp.]
MTSADLPLPLPPPLIAALAILAAYLVGSLSFAVIVSRVMGLADPRSYGSRNPGATNVLRSGNKAAAILTLVFDALKGAVPVLLVLQFGPRFGLGEGTAAFAGLAAFLGHLWPVFFRFEGGKGVATAAGVLLALNPWLGVATLATWIVIAAFFRYSSLAALVSAVFAPFYQALIWGAEPALLAIAIMSVLLVWRHEGNIRKLLAGTESRLGHRAGGGAAAKEHEHHAAGHAHHAAGHGHHEPSHGHHHGAKAQHGSKPHHPASSKPHRKGH